MKKYIYRPEGKHKKYSESVEVIRNAGYPVVTTGIDNTSPYIVKQILEDARDNNLEFSLYKIEIDDYNKYFNDAGYMSKYSGYYSDNRKEKSLEHYVALSLLKINKDDVFIDIASEHSPVSEIYSRLTGATSYSQDIMYPEGINGTRIGGDACAMPVTAGFASKAVLSCSLEHFEGDADTRLFHELYRVLKPGGIVCVIPFYLFIIPATQTDPAVSVTANVIFDKGATIYCAEGWGNRFGRFYNPSSFIERILHPVKDKFEFIFYYLPNTEEIDPSIYARFAFTAIRL